MCTPTETTKDRYLNYTLETNKETTKPLPNKIKRVLNNHLVPFQETIKEHHPRSRQQSTHAIKQTIIKKENNHDMHNNLCKNGYVGLAKTLLGKKGAPWDDITALSSPILMEQVTHLHTICCIEAPPSAANAMQKFFSFCLKVAQQHLEHDVLDFSNCDKDGVNVTSVFLGKALYLVGVDPNETCELVDLDESKAERSKQNIEEQFQKKLRLIGERTKNHVAQHQKIGIQDHTRARMIKLPTEFAMALITNTGAVNVGIISILKKTLLPKDQDHLSHESDIHHILTLLEDSPNMREQLASIQPPKFSGAPAEHIIRIILGLSSQAKITHVDAKRAALSALLSHLRQGNAGSCFATFVAIGTLSTNPKRCLADFKEMLRDSKLTRKINHQLVEFPFLMDSGEESIHRKINLNIKGQVLAQDAILGFIWDSPGMQAACRAAGIDNIAKAVMTVIPLLFPRNKTEKVPVVISIKEILSKLIMNHRLKCLDIQEDIPTLLNRAALAFEGETQNLLQKMWENALAGMAECKESGLLKHSIIESISKPIFEAISVISPKGKHLPWDPLLKSIAQQLTQRIQLQYSPHILSHATSSDEHSAEGAFVLYDRGQSNMPTEWKIINQPSSFQDFVHSIICHAYKGIQQVSLSPRSTGLIDHGYIKIFQTIQSQLFLKSVLEEYDEDNKNNSDLLNQFERLEHTPWLDKSGDDPEEVLRIYQERTDPFSNQVKFTPLNAHQLLSHLIDIGKNSEPEMQEELENNPHSRLPLIVHGLHSCSLLLGHPSMVKAWKSDTHTDAWVNETITYPGQAIAHGPIQPSTCKILIDYMQKLIPAEHQESFKKEAGSIKESLSVHKFRNALLHVISKMHTPEYPTLGMIASEIDKCLCQKALPENQRNIIRDTAVHFADSNWFDGAHDVHFCCIVNPGVGQLEMWQILDDGTGLCPREQAKWVIKRQWRLISTIL